MRARGFSALLIAALGTAVSPAFPEDSTGDGTLAEPNDNRVAAGSYDGKTLRLDLVAQPAGWRPEAGEGSTLPVFAFAESGGTASIPGPLIRVTEGSIVELRLTNRIAEGLPVGQPPANRRTADRPFTTGPELIVHGLRAGTMADDAVRVPYGETRSIQYVANKPGTYLYWGDMTGRSIRERTGLDAQLSGAIIVDPRGHAPPAGERVFFITMIDTFGYGSESFPDNGYFDLAINGLSWPHTERLTYRVGETTHWRWINGSGFEHPMHLHGFHFETRARGNGIYESMYPSETIQEVVTELIEPGNTIRMAWTPTREGNWLMHCHIRDHIIPDPPRDASEIMHDVHDVRLHAQKAMAGLVMGITVTDDKAAEDDLQADHWLRLVARERFSDVSATVRGYAQAVEDEPFDDGFQGPGPPVVLYRGELTRITISSEIQEPTTVHWHGMELPSIYDGVAGWSGSRGRLAPLITSDQSFDAYIRPPRAGTFIYHTHMDETEQLRSGLYGPLIVLEPGQSFEPASDIVFMIGDAVDGEYEGVAINGKRHPDPISLQLNKSYRFRILNMAESATVDVSMVSDSRTLNWLPLAKDGAALPGALQQQSPAEFRFGVGETYDFTWLPSELGDVSLEFDWVFATDPGHLVLRQPMVVE